MPADIFSAAYSRPVTREGAESAPPTHDPPPPPPLHPPPSVAQSSSAPRLTQSHSTTSIATVTESASSGSINSQHQLPRRPVFGRKPASFSGSRRRSSSSTPNAAAANAVVTDTAAPPALPDYALSAAARVASREQLPDVPASPVIGGPDAFPPRAMLSRSGTSNTINMMPPPPTPMGGGSSTNGTSFWQPTDAGVVHQQITDLANKRIATLEYLRKAHGGRVYWFNAYLVDRSDMNRMPSFDSRRLARKATNYLLLGLSLPVIIDLYSSTPLEFLRCLGSLLSEFDSFQQLRNDSSSAALARARIPNMFRRPGGKTRRSTSAADTAEEAAAAAAAGASGSGGGAGFAGMSPGSSAPSFMNFAADESDLIPGEEYTYLLTPSLPFDPDYFETFETLCDTLIDCYARFLALVPTPRECSATVAELFTKADVRVRKIIVQGVVKEFEDCSRANVRSEVANVGKVVLGGLV